MVRRRYSRRYKRRRPSTYLRNRKVAGIGKGSRSRYVAIVPRGLSLKRHHFKQTFHPVNVTTDANCHYTLTGTGALGSGMLYGPSTSDLSPAGYFSIFSTIAELPQQATFTALFDCYRINKVVYKFIPMANSITDSVGVGNLSSTPQWLSTVIDFDDSTLLSSEASLLEYENFKQTGPYRKHIRSFVPAVSMDVYRTGGSTLGYTQTRKRWIDAANTDVPHYGVKGLINGPASQADQGQMAWKVYVTMYISFKQTR